MPFKQTPISFYQNTASTRKKTPECDDRDHQVFHFYNLSRLDICRVNPFSFIAMLSAVVINYLYSHWPANIVKRKFKQTREEEREMFAIFFYTPAKVVK